MIALLLSAMASTGAYLAWTSIAHGRTTLGRSTDRPPRERRRSPDLWLAQAGLAEVNRREFAGVLLALGACGAACGWLMFAGVLPALAIGLFSASFPIAGYRVRRRTRRALAAEAWPRLIEEIRVRTSSLGRSIPQALLEVGLRGPEELRPAFEAAQREWVLSTDFARTISVLKELIADPTADTVCETLLVAHEVGGNEIDKRLEALAVDRSQDCQGRKDARSRQAGARFARRFVLFVPLGMAFAGMSVGDGRAAYASPMGQLLVLIGIAVVVACWVWAGRVMRLPEAERVFAA